MAAHVDREGFGLVGQLGFVPPALELDALEVSPRAELRDWSVRWREFPVITSSDAHRLSEIGRSSTSFLAREASFDEIGMALTARAGRRVLVH